MNTTISAVGRRRDDGRYEITETVIVERHVLSDAIDGYASRGVTVMFPPERAETPAALPAPHATATKEGDDRPSDTEPPGDSAGDSAAESPAVSLKKFADTNPTETFALADLTQKCMELGWNYGDKDEPRRRNAVSEHIRQLRAKGEGRIFKIGNGRLTTYLVGDAAERAHAAARKVERDSG